MFGKSSSKKTSGKHVIDSLLDARSTIKGDVSFSGGMQIHGRVFGDVKGIGTASILVVGKDAVIEGAVEADHIFVDGTIVGPVKGAIMVVVRPHGKITGDVHYGKIQMEEGSLVKGQLLPIPSLADDDIPATKTVPMTRMQAA